MTHVAVVRRPRRPFSKAARERFDWLTGLELGLPGECSTRASMRLLRPLVFVVLHTMFLFERMQLELDNITVLHCGV